MLYNRNSSQKDGDSLIVTRRGTSLASPSVLTTQTITASHTGSNIRVNTPDMSDTVVLVQVPESVSSHDYGRDMDTMAELTRSTSDIETGCTRPDRGVLRVRENLLYDEADNKSEETSC